MYVYYDNQGKVKMISEEKIETTLQCKKVRKTSTLTDHLQKNSQIHVEDGELKFKENIRMKHRIAEEEKQKFKERISEATLEDIKEFIIKYI